MDLHSPLHAPLSHQNHSKPTQVPFSLALCPRPTHPSDPVATGPLPRPLHPLTPHLLTHCPTLSLAFFVTSANHHHPHWPSTPKMYRKSLLKFVLYMCSVYIWMFTWYFGVYIFVYSWGRGFQQCLMRLGRMSGNGRKSASPPVSVSFQLLSPLCQLFFNSASQPLYLNMFLSHLSITSFQSIFICVASHSLSQSISVPRERWCVSR